MFVKFNSNVCRICLETNGSISLFNEKSVYENFRFVTLIEASTSDGLPENLCQKCNISLKVAFQLKTQSIAADVQLKSYLEKINQNFLAIPKQSKTLETLENNIIELNELVSEKSEIETKPTIIDIIDDDDIIIEEHVSEDIDNFSYDQRSNSEEQKLTKPSAEIFENIDLEDSTESVSDILQKTIESKSISNENNTGELIVLQKLSEDSQHDCIVYENQNLDDVQYENSVNTSPINKTNEIKLCQVSTLIPTRGVFKITEHTSSSTSNSSNEKQNCYNFDTEKIMFSEDHFLPTEQSKPDEEVKLVISDNEENYEMVEFIEEDRDFENNIETENSIIDSEDIPVIKLKQKLQKNELKIHQKLNLKKPEVNEAKKKKYGLVNDMLQCSECENVFTTKLNLDRHMKIHKDQRKSFDCKLCGKLFTQPSSVREHMLSHTGEKPYNCDICSKSFSRLQVFKRHRLTHINLRNWICDQCGVKFSSKQSLLLHITREHGHAESVSHTCWICSKTYRSKYTLNDHILNQHKDSNDLVKIRNLECLICQQTLENKKLYDTHMKMHEITENQCLQCSESFLTKNELNIHIATHNLNEKYPCDVCGQIYDRKFKFLAHLQEHERDTIKEINENGDEVIVSTGFRCKKCAKEFLILQNLHEHIKAVHVNFKNNSYKCSECDECFVSRSAMKTHYVNNHQSNLNQADYCNLCYLSFMSFDAYYDHIRNVHDAVNKEFCLECETDLVDEKDFIDHVIQHNVVII